MSSNVPRLLQRSVSLDPLPAKDGDDSSDEERPLPGGGVLRRTASMSPLKPAFGFDSHSHSDSEYESGDDNENEVEEDREPDSDDEGLDSENEPGTGAYLIPEHEDDMFVERRPGDYPSRKHPREQAFWPTKAEEFDETSEEAVATLTPVKVDPQGVYPPTACIFVANLASQVEDENLERQVTKVFSRYGTVFVKIRRDARKMPFAFCQFTADKDAQAALEDKKDLILFGRKVRKEKAKANSVFLISRFDGEEVTERDAFKLMDQFGAISHLYKLDSKSRHEMNMSGAVVVNFKMFDAQRDVVGALREHKTFYVVSYDPQRPPVGTPTRHLDRDSGFNQQQIDRRSAYMGNLPNDMCQEELEELVADFGVVKSTLARKHILGGMDQTTFAFVEFTRHDTVQKVIDIFDGADIRGYVIRVQRKQSRPAFPSPGPSSHYQRSPASAQRPRGYYTPTRTPHHFTPSRSQGRTITSAGPLSEDRGASYGTRSGGNVLVSPSPVGRGRGILRDTTARTSLSDARTPAQPGSKFSSDSSLQSNTSPTKGKAPSTVPRTSKSRSNEQGTNRTPERAEKEEPSAPKSSGKGKAAVRPKSLQSTASVSTDYGSVSPVQEIIPSRPSSPEADDKDQGEHVSDGAGEGSHSHQGVEEGIGQSNLADSPAYDYPPATYAMPTGYIPATVSPYGNPSMGWPNPYGAPMHTPLMNSYFGYPPGFVWSDPYAGAHMMPGLTPSMSLPPMPGPPPDRPLPDLPPTRNRSGGPSGKEKTSRRNTKTNDKVESQGEKKDSE